MFTITDDAAHVLRGLLHAGGREAAIRVTPNDDTPGEPGFQLSLVDRPAPGDARAAADPPVYLAPGAAAALRGQSLDAESGAGPAELRIIPHAA